MKLSLDMYDAFSASPAAMEPARSDFMLTSAEVAELLASCGEKTLQLGRLEANGSLLLPVDRVVEAFGVLGSQPVGRSGSSVNPVTKIGDTESMLRSLEALVDRVCESRDRMPRVESEFAGEQFQD